MPYTGDKKRQYDREWAAKRRADYFVDKFCVRCGSIEQLELDHIDPSTKVDSRIWTWRESRRLAEIAKCQVLCHDCHLEKTVGERSVEHGGGAWGKRNCKCEPCLAKKRAANAAWMREYRKKNMVR